MQTKNLQVIPNGVMPRINASQYDNGREVHFLLYDGSSPYTIPAGADVRVEGAKSDGNGFSYDCTYSGNNVTVIIRTQMTVIAEDVICELRISVGDTDIGTLNFVLAVEKSALPDDIPISDTEIPAIIELARSEQYESEAWAQGTKNGIPVSSDDPQYHNNAKYWAEHSQGGSFANLSDVDIDDPQEGQVPVYNPITEKWENQNAPSGGLLPHLFIDSEPESTVTVVAPDLSIITPTQASSGHWECDVFEYGVYTIHAVINGDDAVVTLTVDDVKEYHITDAHFSYTLSVYAPIGSTIRVIATGETYTETGAGSTAVIFALHQSETTYTIQVTLDGVSKSDTITTPSTSEGSGSKTFEYGTINALLDAEFVGATITCSLGSVTINKTAVSTSLTFYPPTTGTWTISGIASGTSYSVDAEVTSLNTPVNVELHTLPDGETIVPTDDIQTWLACAGITDKSYTMLSEVLADNTTLLALVSNDNASDYLVRSTTWISGITTSQIAMTDIATSNYCADVLLGNLTWLTAICNSSYFENLLDVKVPTMTGATTPSGEVYSNSVLNATYAGWKAFNGVLGTNGDTNRWVSAGGKSGTEAFLQYDFGTPVKVCKTVIYATLNQSNEHSAAASINIEGSNNGTSYTPITSKEMSVSEMSQYTDIIAVNNSYYQYYRVYFSNTNMYGTASDYYSQIRSLQLYGRENV